MYASVPKNTVQCYGDPFKVQIPTRHLSAGRREPAALTLFSRPMWQRKQSIFLFMAALLSFATWLFPVVTYERASDAFSFCTTGLFTQDGATVADVGVKVPFAIVLTVLGVALLAIILLFKDRPRQVRFLRGTYLVMLGVIAFLFITDNSIEGYLEQGGTVVSHYGASFFLPLGVLLFAFLAERAIKADEALVKSADRLR